MIGRCHFTSSFSIIVATHGEGSSLISPLYESVQSTDCVSVTPLAPSVSVSYGLIVLLWVCIECFKFTGGVTVSLALKF